MKAYLAVLKDSFREALASRVLWILLALTTLVLAALAPIGLSEKPSTQLRQNNILNMSAFISKIETQGRADEPSPGKQIWSRLGDDLKTRLANREGVEAGSVPANLARELVDALNTLLSDRNFYEPSAWRGIDLNDETKTLADRRTDSLTDDEVKRRNRLLLEAAYPAQIAGGRAELSISYLAWHVTEVPLSRQEATPVIKGIVAAIMNFFVGTLGVLAAILVTAPIIPHTFEAGSIDLLLSKPISRSLLFLTKFAGGCAFILLNAAYFIVGLWLIAGLRFDIWSGRLLLSIPIFLFLFAIYYAVSSAAGVLWRNAVVSIVVTILFWVACFAVGTTKTVMEETWLNSSRLMKLVSAGDSLFGVTEQGQMQEWRATTEKWEETFQAEGPTAPRGGPFFIPQQWTSPVYDSRGDRLLAVETPFGGGRGFGGAARVPTLWFATRTDGWARRKGPVAPVGTTEVFVEGNGEILAAGVQGMFRLSRNDAGQPDGDIAAETFIPAGPNPPLQLQAPLAYALNGATGEIAIRSQSTVTVLERNSDGNFSKKHESEISGGAGAVLAFAGSTLLAALEDGRVLLLDAATLKVQQEFLPAREFTPRFAMADANGRWFAVLSHNRTLRMFDARAGKPADVAFSGQGDISAAAFKGDRLLVSDRVNRVTSYQLDPFRTQDRRAPALAPLERVYRYALVPIYTIFPKPGELGNVVSYLLTERETVASNPSSGDLTQRRVKINIYGPVWSSLAFLVVVMTLTCLYVSRTDF
jgi:ABC-type transport system involved in multi-copper enzyme maturation permease subunit